MRAYFSHGKESGPWGTKIRRLAPIAEAAGYDVESIDYTDTMDPDRRADRLSEILADDKGEFVLVGSSMGGYVSVAAAEQHPARGIFLMAPALYIPGWARQEYHPRSARLEIVHGWSDAVIPPEHSIRFAGEIDCSLHLISGDHALNSSLNEIEALFENFLRTLDQQQAG
jgi:pimeloyl-ACP methyl ester carboxylesterase